MYNKIFPSRTLDVASIVDPADLTQQSLTGVSHLCWLCCTAPGVVSCPTCAKEVFRVDDTVALCQECYEKSHTCRDHQTYPHGKVTMFSKMELLSVICIETSHSMCVSHAVGIDGCSMTVWLIRHLCAVQHSCLHSMSTGKRLLLYYLWCEK